MQAKDIVLGAEAQVLIGDWRIDYNENRPHSAHGDLTPTEFATAWPPTPSPNPKPPNGWTTHRGPLTVHGIAGPSPIGERDVAPLRHPIARGRSARYARRRKVRAADLGEHPLMGKGRPSCHPRHRTALPDRARRTP
jgi:hypothetical protein